MNEEVAKAKEISEGADKESLIRQLSGFCSPLDLESYITKVNCLSFLFGDQLCGSIVCLYPRHCFRLFISHLFERYDGHVPVVGNDSETV